MFWNDFLRCRGNTWTMCEFHDSNCNGFGDMWGTDKCIYFSSVDYSDLFIRPVHTIEKMCARLVRETPFIHSAVKTGSKVLTLVRWLISLRRYSVTITLQIEKYSLSFAHNWSWCPMTNNILIWNNDPSTFPNDTFDGTRNRDVSLNCTCSAEKVYCGGENCECLDDYKTWIFCQIFSSEHCK